MIEHMSYKLARHTKNHGIKIIGYYTTLDEIFVMLKLNKRYNDNNLYKGEIRCWCASEPLECPEIYRKYELELKLINGVIL